MKELWSYLGSIGFFITSLVILYLINPYNYGYFFGYLLFALIFVKNDFLSKNLDFNFLLLCLFSFIYALFFSFSETASLSKQFIIIYALTPPTFYLLGKYLTGYESDDKGLFYLLFTLTTLFSFTALLSVFANFLEGGFIQLDRNLPDFWDGRVLNATLMGGYFTFNMCIPSILIVCSRRMGKVFNISSIALFVVSLICVLRLGSRTQLGIFFITTVLALLYIVPKQSFKKNLTLIGILTVIIGYALTHISFDLNADWLTTYSSRLEDKGNSIANGGGRTDKWAKSVEFLSTHPLGWSIKEFGFSHNLWFDAARVAGIIPFIILVVFGFRTFRKLWKTLHLEPKPLELNIMFLVYGVGFFIVLNIEPILDGIFPFFVLFCTFSGILNKNYENRTL